MNSNDPEVNPDIVSNDKDAVRHDGHIIQDSHKSTGIQTASIDSSHRRHGVDWSENSKSDSESVNGPDTCKPRHERRLSHEGGDIKRSTGSPLRHDVFGRKTLFESPHHHLGVISTDSPKRVSRQSLGSDRSTEQSPLHPHHQARLGNKNSGVPSPSWERKGSSEGNHGLAPSTPGRSRLRSVTRGDETPDHSPAVPKFGDWDESDPASAEGFTQVFERVREEKQSGTAKVPIMSTETSYSNGQRQYGSDNPKGCLCFPWGRK